MNLLDNEKIDPETGNKKSNFEFCYEKSIVGIGWGLCEHTATDYDEYKKLTKLEGRYYKDGKYDGNLKDAMDCLEDMDEGHLILLHDKYMTFYVCEVLDKKIEVNQDTIYYDANATCNKKVRYLDIKMSAKELQGLGLQRDDYIVIGATIRPLQSTLAERLENHIRKTYPSYLS